MAKPKPVADLTATLAKQLSNKIAAGGSLTGAEIAFLERQQAKEQGGEKQGEFAFADVAKNKLELAKVLGLSRVTLDKYWKHKDRPTANGNGSHNVKQWQAFLAKHAPKSGAKFPVNGNIEGEETEPAKLSFRERKERAEALRAEHDFKLAEGKAIDRAQAVEDVRKANEVVKAELIRRFGQVAPNQYATVDGDADACRAINEKHLEEIFEFLHSGEWKPKA